MLHSIDLEHANCCVDVSDYFARKLETLSLHVSQVSDPDNIAAFMERLARQPGEKAGCRYAEAFVRLRLPE